MIKGAIFDMDGVILDSMPVWSNAVSYFLETLGINAPADISEVMFPMTISEGVVYLKKTFDLELSTKKISDGISETVLNFYKSNIPLKPYVKDFLQLLKKNNIKITLATTSDRSMAEAAFERLGISELIDKIFTANETGFGKDVPNMFFMAAEYMNTEKEETWLFEDALHSVETAKKAGFKTVGIYDEASLKKQAKLKEICDVYLTSWEKPKELFERLYTY